MQHGAALPSSDGEGRAVSVSGHDPAAGERPTGRPAVRILTPRLRLTEVAESDEAELYALHSDPRAFVEDSTDPLTDPAQMRWVLAQWREGWARHGLGHLTVRAREEHGGGTGEDLPTGLLGVVGLAPLVGGTQDPDDASRAADARTVLSAYWRLSPAATGRGIATEAMLAVLDAVRAQRPSDVPPPEIVAITAGGNAPSLALADRLGFRPAPPDRSVPGGRDGDVLLVLPEPESPRRSLATP